MGQLDQFSKRTFASDTTPVTGGVFAWNDGAEIGLTHIQPDGYLVVLDPEGLAALPAPWSEANDYPAPIEIVIELKMPGDHLGWPAISRAELRRVAREVQRLEDLALPWEGVAPLWIIAPHVPAILAERCALICSAPGCYRIATGKGRFPFLWVAANELPLREELIPFLLARSGKAKDEFVRWVAERRPVAWLLDMVEFTPMSTSIRDELFERIRRTDDPEALERRRWLMAKLLEISPDLLEEKAQTGRLDEARSMLRRVFARRGLALSVEQQGRIEACSELGTLERWHDAAITAASAAEALQ